MCLCFVIFLVVFKSSFYRRCVALPFPATMWRRFSAPTIWSRLARPFLLSPIRTSAHYRLHRPNTPMFVNVFLESLYFWFAPHGLGAAF